MKAINLKLFSFYSHQNILFSILFSVQSISQKRVNVIIDCIIPLQSYLSRFIAGMAKRLQSLSQIITDNKKSRMEEARSRNKLNGEQLRAYLYGEGNYQKYVKPIYNIFDQNKHIYTHHNIEGHTLKEQRKEAAIMSMHLLQNLKLNVEEPQKIFFANYAVSHFDSGVGTKTFLSFILYSKSIYNFQNKEIHKSYLQKAGTLQDIGCFALTQFHHGSYSKGIQTLATYDHDKKAFIFSTQGTKGMKYWIGALSQFANNAIIWAQLIVKGKSYGPHPFIAQIRCKKTRKPFPGITIGDCGPKNGGDYIDNGYMILDNFVVPKDNLLGKFGDIDNEGNYKSKIKSSNQRFGLFMSALSGGRASLALSTCSQALNALTIALRYSCSRKQFDTPSKIDQIIIIDYAITKHRIIPNIARTLMQMWASIPVGLAYFSKKLNLNDDNYISELHAISASLKAYNTWNNAASADESRTILGGHGYSAFSRISSLYHDLDVNVTWQGDNNMLLQQTSKYLMRAIPQKIKTSIVDLSFIDRPIELDLQKISQSLGSIDNLQWMMKDCLSLSYKNAQATLAYLSKIHKDKNEVMLNFHPEAGNSLSLNYVQYYIFSVNKQRIKSLKTQQNIQFLSKCLNLFSLSVLEKRKYGNYILRKQIQKEIVSLCNELTQPCIVALDVLSPSSFIIGSPFANPNDDGFKEYVNLLYTNKDTFRRIPYYKWFVQNRTKLSSA